MTAFRHDMPFGAQLMPDGNTRFRLWAPSQPKVALKLADRDHSLPMERAEDGWLQVTVGAPAGTQYSYSLPDGLLIPDPASRQQSADVHGPSVVTDPGTYEWRNSSWRGRPWHEAVLYELHVGAFNGDFNGVRRKLDHLEQLGVTAIELMPVADFAGKRNWGYDGVLPFAPDRVYGPPDSLKQLIDEAHARRLMVFLDVVYNHFGPEGNYLAAYAQPFFTDRHATPWGAAIDFSHRTVRDFFIHNALYWLNEFRFDGLRFDAVHAIVDDGREHILDELAGRVRSECGNDRHVHLMLENDANQSRFLTPYDAQWNDDFHHAAHVVLTRESEGYYADYQRDPLQDLGRALAEGFVYQGETSIHRGGAPRGEPTAALDLTVFVNFLQNHDQVGNRAFGERLAQLVLPDLLKAAASILLLGPSIPMIFMGEEWASVRPFQFFCDFTGDLAQAVREGRRREFAKFPAFAEPGVRDRIPDPNDPATFEQSRLNWQEVELEALAAHLALCRALLAIRREAIVPRLRGTAVRNARFSTADGLLQVSWELGDGSVLALIANLRSDSALMPAASPTGDVLYATHRVSHEYPADERPPVPGWFVAWYLTDAQVAS
jgi:maltooligosyltrehalose trehalohydrolase